MHVCAGGRAMGERWGPAKGGGGEVAAGARAGPMCGRLWRRGHTNHTDTDRHVHFDNCRTGRKHAPSRPKRGALSRRRRNAVGTACSRHKSRSHVHAMCHVHALFAWIIRQRSINLAKHRMTHMPHAAPCIALLRPSWPRAAPCTGLPHLPFPPRPSHVRHCSHGLPSFSAPAPIPPPCGGQCWTTAARRLSGAPAGRPHPPRPRPGPQPRRRRCARGRCVQQPLRPPRTGSAAAPWSAAAPGAGGGGWKHRWRGGSRQAGVGVGGGRRARGRVIIRMCWWVGGGKATKWKHQH